MHMNKQTQQSTKESRKKPSKKQYHIRNWHDYNEALVQRGSLEVWISEEAMEEWYAEPTGEAGAQPLYSDLAISTVLTIEKVFHLPLRATAGFVGSVFRMTEIELPVPDYSTLSRRSDGLTVHLAKRRKEKLIMIVDGSGAKIFGEGEWKVRQHGWSKRRTWKKIHIGIDADGEIRAEKLTGNDTHDSEVVEDLFDQESAEIQAFAGDGAFDTADVYTSCQNRGIPRILIPPRHGAKMWQHGNCRGDPHPRDENLRAIRKKGRKRWKAESGYHIRSGVENTLFRWKTIFGDRLRSRADARQRTEARIIASALNRMLWLGMPDSYAYAIA
jgi:Transposase DDE domain